MVTVVTVPAATASATTTTLLVQLRESLCQAYCTTSSIQPVVNVTYNTGSTTIKENAAGTYDAFVPINAIGSITFIPKGTNKTVTKLFAETFDVAFSGLTSSAPTFVITTGTLTIEQSNIKCCNRAYGVDINTIVTITGS